MRPRDSRILLLLAAAALATAACSRAPATPARPPVDLGAFRLPLAANGSPFDPASLHAPVIAVNVWSPD